MARLLKLKAFTSGKPNLYLIGVGTYALVVACKVSRCMWMVIGGFTVNRYSPPTYVLWQNNLDVLIVVAAMVNDLYCSGVILWQSKEDFSGIKNNFLATLVKLTELRIIIIVILQVLAFILICMQQGAVSGSAGIELNKFNARNIYVDVVYSLFYVDYLLIKATQKGETLKMTSNQTSNANPTGTKSLGQASSHQ
jgi:hypothetical protein